jgi:hypothetical protein
LSAVRWMTGMAGRPSGNVTTPSYHKGFQPMKLSNKMQIFLKCNCHLNQGWPNMALKESMCSPQSAEWFQ